MLSLINALSETGGASDAFSKVGLDYFNFQKNYLQWLFKSSETGRIKLTQQIY